MISIEDLSVCYGKKEVLTHLSCQFPTEKVSGIIGENGAGKTTLMHAIAGLIPVPRNKILIDEMVLRWDNLSFVPTNPFFYPYITGRDYLKLFNCSDSVIEQWGRILNLPIDGFIDTYSSGMQKKIAIAGSVSSGKRILVMDEPFNSLDIESVYILEKIIKALRCKNHTIIISSHIVETLLPLCDVILELENGCVKQRTPGQYLEMQQALRNKYEDKYNKLLDEVLSEID